MAHNRRDRFFRTTRGRLITLLRGKGCTVNDLAAALGVTDNAVRAHLLALERDGLVYDSGMVAGTRRPHVVYSLTAQAEQMFPKAYEPVLGELLKTMARRLSPKRMEGLLRAVGRRLAGTFKPAAQATLRQRAKTAVEALGELGGLAELEEEDGRLIIRGQSCPLQSAVTAHPSACRVAEALLSEIVGAPVRERCDKTGSPRCCFEILSPS